MKIAFLLLFFFTLSGQIEGQSLDNSQFSDTLQYQKRKNQFLIGTASVYTASSVGLYFAWYKNYNQQGFHFFNDWNEWNNMDKLGHMYSTYFQSDLLFRLGQWSGYDEKQSLNIACLTALGFQTSFEIMDGFSSRWGFSIPDFTFNLLGAGSFYTQQKIWHEQRIRIKFSYWPEIYSNHLYSSETDLFNYTLNQRASGLYGTSFMERLVKDYNGQTIWLSANLKSFWPSAHIPSWLNLAIGVSADNLYGGFNNNWEINDENFTISEDLFPRKHQFIISPDIDFSKIKTKSSFLRTFFDLLNIIKFPAPALVFDSTGKIGLSLFYLN